MPWGLSCLCNPDDCLLHLHAAFSHTCKMLENEIEVVEMEDIGRGRDVATGLCKGSTNKKVLICFCNAQIALTPPTQENVHLNMGKKCPKTIQAITNLPPPQVKQSKAQVQ